MPFIAERSMTRPPSLVPYPGALWPPPRTDTRSPNVRAKLTACWMSATPIHRAMSAGRRSTLPFHTRRASSYFPSPGTTRSPRRFWRRLSTSVSCRAVRVPSSVVAVIVMSDPPGGVREHSACQSAPRGRVLAYSRLCGQRPAWRRGLGVGLFARFLNFRPSGATPSYGSWTSNAEEVPRPPGEQVVNEHEEDEQGQQHGHEAQADPGQPPIQTARLLLLRDRTLLELDHALEQAPALGELIALHIADVAQEMPDVVVAVHAQVPTSRVATS